MSDFRNWVDAIILATLEQICGESGFFLFMESWRRER